MTSESSGSQPGMAPQPIGEIESAIERARPPLPDPGADEPPAVKPIGEIESAIERSCNQD